MCAKIQNLNLHRVRVSFSISLDAFWFFFWHRLDFPGACHTNSPPGCETNRLLRMGRTDERTNNVATTARQCNPGRPTLVTGGCGGRGGRGDFFLTLCGRRNVDARPVPGCPAIPDWNFFECRYGVDGRKCVEREHEREPRIRTRIRIHTNNNAEWTSSSPMCDSAASRCRLRGSARGCASACIRRVLVSLRRGLRSPTLTPALWAWATRHRNRPRPRRPRTLVLPMRFTSLLLISRPRPIFPQRRRRIIW